MRGNRRRWLRLRYRRGRRDGRLRLHRELLLDAVNARRQLSKQVTDCLEVALGRVHTGRGSRTANYPRNASALHVVFLGRSY